MSWNRAQVADAVVGLLQPFDATVTCFVAPPATFNPPAYVVGWPTTVVYDTRLFGIDVATLPVAAAGGVEETDRVDELLETARKALDDGNLSGTVQHARVMSQANWRPVRVSGIDMLVADLVLEIQM
jgi:hypothetical protein